MRINPYFGVDCRINNNTLPQFKNEKDTKNVSNVLNSVSMEPEVDYV